MAEAIRSASLASAKIRQAPFPVLQVAGLVGFAESVVQALCAALAQLHGLQIHHLTGLNAETQQRADLVEAVPPGRAGV